MPGLWLLARSPTDRLTGLYVGVFSHLGRRAGFRIGYICQQPFGNNSNRSLPPRPRPRRSLVSYLEGITYPWTQSSLPLTTSFGRIHKASCGSNSQNCCSFSFRLVHCTHSKTTYILVTQDWEYPLPPPGNPFHLYQSEAECLV